MQDGLRTAVMVRRLSSLGGMAQWRRLQALFEDVFGTGDRPTQWFQRKLRREVVDEHLSWLAVTDQGHWCGYVLLGRPPSLPGVARTAGVGVTEGWRGHGIGRRLMAAAVAAAEREGSASLRTVSSGSARPFYHRLGFVSLRCLTTLQHRGGAERDRPLPPPLPWQPALSTDHATSEVCGWLKEAWELTEPDLRRTLVVPTRSGPSVVHLAREGVAWLIHRLVCPPQPNILEAVLEEVRSHFQPSTRLLIAATEPPVRDRLFARGWKAAQVGYEMELAMLPTLLAGHGTKAPIPGMP